MRLNKHDGFSEIVIKSILLGQYPISYIPYGSGVWDYKTESELRILLRHLQNPPASERPNIEGREAWIAKLNNFPWMEK